MTACDRSRAGLVAALLTVLAVESHAASSAFRVTDPSDLLVGTSAQGSVGDYRLSNDFVAVIIDDIPNPHGFASTGGNIIDAAEAGGEDRFSSLFTFFDNKFGRQALYTNLTIVDDGSTGGTARIRVTGVDSEEPTLAVTTDYSLAPGMRHVVVETTFVNGGTTPVTAFRVGDALQWGLTTHFLPGWDNDGRNVPGDGHDIGGITIDATWVGGDGLGSSYGYTAPVSSMEVQNGSTWSDGNVAYLDVAVGGSAGYERYFIVGDGSLSSVSDTVFALTGTTTGTLAGRVTELGTGDPIEGAVVAITTTECLGTVGAVSYTLATTDANGDYSADLEPGSYEVLIEAVGRAASGCLDVGINASLTTMLDIDLSGQSSLSWMVTDAAGFPLPAKVSLLHSPVNARRDGPELGDKHEAIGGYAILSATGSGQTPVAPGTYEVWVSRGTEYDAHVETVVLTPGSTTNVAAVLDRVVDTTGYLSADMHVHAFNSADSGIPFELRAEQSAAEGLEICVPTDHDFRSDMTAAIGAVGLERWVGTLPGNEVTTIEWGHFNGYPLTVAPAQPRNGALVHDGLTPTDIFSTLRADPRGPIVQVNHPRAGGLGYFDLMAINPLSGASPALDFSDDFDAVEVFNGKRLSQVATVRNDWYRLLNEGMNLTGVGNTDTHVVFSQEIGYPRNFVQVGSDDPAAFAEADFRDAVRDGRTFFTNGPFVELWVNGDGLGSLVTDQDGTVDVRVRIQAPNWVAVDTLDIVVNGTVERTVAITPIMQPERLDDTYAVSLTRDSWIAVEVRGGDCSVDGDNDCLTGDCPGRLDPIVPPLFGTQPVCPYAHTNVVRIDRDGNGQFDPPGNRGLIIEPIADTRPIDGSGVHLRADEIVSVRGDVVAPSYVFSNRSNTVYFQDDSLDPTAKLSGGTTIYQNNLIQPVLELGDVIQVTGTITQFFGLTELTGVSIDVLARDRPVPDPMVLTVAQLRNVANDEQWEGMLVRVNGLTISGGTWPGFGSNANITVTDSSTPQTITMRVDGDTNVDGTAAPSQPFDLVAVVGQFRFSAPLLGFHQLLPRQRIDIIEPGDPLRILHGPAAYPATSCDATIHWYTTLTGDSVVEYGLDQSYGMQVSDAAAVHSHSLTLTGLTAGTTHHYRVISGGVASPDQTFVTAPSPTPTIVRAPQAGIVNDTVVQVTWQTDVPAGSVVEYGSTMAYGMTEMVAGARTEHVVTLTGIDPAVGYHYRVRSAASACGGGEGISPDGQFMTGVQLAIGEVSGPASGVPLWVTTNANGSTKVSFEELAGAEGYNVYVGTLGTWFDHGATGLSACAATTTVDGPGRLAVEVGPAGLTSRYFLVTAYSGGVEGPSGAASSGTTRPASESTCAP